MVCLPHTNTVILLGRYCGTITEPGLPVTKHQIDWDPAICITYSTDYYQRFTLESWFTKLEQTPLNRSQQLTKRRTNYLLTRSSKTNYERITGELTI